MGKTRTPEQFIQEMQQINPNISILEPYINNQTKLKCRCLIDGYEWYTAPFNLIRNH